MKTEIKANRRVYDIVLSQKRGDRWGGGKPWDGMVEVYIEYARRGAWDFATILVSWKEDGSLNLREHEGTHRIAPTSLASLKKQLVEFINENEEEIKAEVLL